MLSKPFCAFLFLVLAFSSTLNTAQAQCVYANLVGTYEFRDWRGGGFTGGPAGISHILTDSGMITQTTYACYSLPPDYWITETLNLHPDSSATLNIDTSSGKWFKFTLFTTTYRGKASLHNDTLSISFTEKEIMSFFILDSMQKDKFHPIDSTFVQSFVLKKDDSGEMHPWRLTQHYQEEFYIKEEQD